MSWFYLYAGKDPYFLISFRIFRLGIKLKDSRELLFSERNGYYKYRHDFKKAKLSLIIDWRNKK